MQTLRILREEHRTLAVVLGALLQLVGEIRSKGTEPNFTLIGAMIYYLDTFSERIHHPKEDAYLFPRLRQRCQAARDALDRVAAEHRAGARNIAQLAQAFARYQSGGPHEFYAFEAIVEAYCAIEFRHMRTEETELLTLAERYLTPADWAEIDRVFLDHEDPLFGVTAGERFRELFLRIETLACPAIRSITASASP